MNTGSGPQKLRAAIVGMETHAKGILRDCASCQDVEIVALADAAEHRAARIEEYPDWAFYDLGDCERMYDERKIDLAIVACKPSEKVGPVCAAIQRGIHVMADKPLCTEQEHLDRICKAHTARPAADVAMRMTLRSNPYLMRMREIVRRGGIGDVICCYAKRCFATFEDRLPAWYWTYDCTGGPTVELAIHDVDVVRWITALGFDEVRAHEINGGHSQWPQYAASGACFFRMTNGASAIIEHSRHVQDPLKWNHELHVTGTRGQLIYDRMGGDQPPTDREQLWTHLDGRVETLEYLGECRSVVRDWVGRIQGRDGLSGITTAETLDLMKLVLTARQSVRTGRLEHFDLPVGA